MYGLPDNADLSFLVSQQLQQVCIGEHQAILRFCGSSIAIEADIAHKSKSGEITTLYKAIVPSAHMLTSFLACTITNVVARPEGTLLLEFSNGEAIEIYDTNKHYESYQIQYGDKVIVV